MKLGFVNGLHCALIYSLYSIPTFKELRLYIVVLFAGVKAGILMVCLFCMCVPTDSKPKHFSFACPCSDAQKKVFNNSFNFSLIIGQNSCFTRLFVKLHCCVLFSVNSPTKLSLLLEEDGLISMHADVDALFSFCNVSDVLMLVLLCFSIQTGPITLTLFNFECVEWRKGFFSYLLFFPSLFMYHLLSHSPDRPDDTPSFSLVPEP